MKYLSKKDNEYIYREFTNSKTNGEKYRSIQKIIWDKVDKGFEKDNGINLFNKLITIKLAEYNIENYIPEIRAIQYDDKNIEKAKTLNAVIKGLWSILDIPEHILNVYKNATKYGTAITKIYWDSEVKTMKGLTGQIKFKQIPINEFFIDEKAHSIDSAYFLGYKKEWTLYQLLNDDIMTNKENKNLENDIRQLYFSDGKEEDFSKYFLDRVVIYHYYTRISGKHKKYIIYELCLDDKNNNLIVMEDKYELNFFPFVEAYYDKMNTEIFYGDSLFKYTTKIIELQNQINDSLQKQALLSTRQLLTYNKNVVENPEEVKKKILGFLNKGEKMDPISTIGVRPQDGSSIKDVFAILPFTEYNEALLQYSALKNEEIENTMHINKMSRGMDSGSVSTTGGIKYMVDRATLVPKFQSNEIKNYIKRFIHKLISFISEYHLEKIKIPVNVPEYQEEEFVEYVGADFKKMGYDINTEIVPLSSAERIQQKEDVAHIFSILAQNQQDGKNTALVMNLIKPIVNSMQILNKKEIINKINAQEYSYRYKVADQILSVVRHFCYFNFMQNYSVIIQQSIDMYFAETLEKAKTPEAKQEIQIKIDQIKDYIKKIKIPKELIKYMPMIAKDQNDMVDKMVTIMKSI